MFERDPETKKIGFTHNPFSMPQGGLEALNTMDPLDILAYQYDIVCNGVELSSGAVRNHDMQIMVKAFEIAGYDEEVLNTIESLKVRACLSGSYCIVGRYSILYKAKSNSSTMAPFSSSTLAADITAS